VCTSVNRLSRRRWWGLLWFVLIGTIPLLAVWVMIALRGPLAALYTRGLTPGNVRINREYEKLEALVSVVHYYATPAAVIVLLLLLTARYLRAEGELRPPGTPIFLPGLVLGLLTGAACWSVGWLALVVTYWNE
jgi:hypothetical protein